MEDLEGSIDVEAEIEVQTKGAEVACKVGIMHNCTAEQRENIATACVTNLKLLGLQPRKFMSHARETVKVCISNAGSFELNSSLACAAQLLCVDFVDCDNY